MISLIVHIAKYFIRDFKIKARLKSIKIKLRMLVATIKIMFTGIMVVKLMSKTIKNTFV